MKIIYRYVVREALLFFSICLFAFTGILLTLRMLRFAALIVDKGVEVSQIASVFVAIIPTFLEIAIPLATLLGVMLAMGRLSGDSEVVVMRASGLSIGQLTWPALGFGVAAACIGLLVSLELKPWGFEKLSRTLFDIARTKSTSGLEPGVFNKLGSITLYSEEIDYSSGALSKVLIDDRRDPLQRKIFLAESGSIRSDESKRTIEFILHKAEIHEQTKRGSPPWRSAEIRLSISPDQLFDQENQKGRVINELTVPELRERLAYLRGTLLPIVPPEGEIDALRYPLPVPPSVYAEATSLDDLRRRILRSEIELGQRFSLPFASLALALLALPLGVQPPRAHRTWGAGLSATLGLVVFVLYFGVFSVGIVLAQAGTLPTAVALWLPNLLVLSLAAYALYKTGTESWHSVSAAIHDAALQLSAAALRRWKRGVAT